ncbi:hypothetical protein [Streptomyces sp. NPDC058955]
MSIKTRVAALLATAVAAFGLALGATTLLSDSDTAVTAGTVTNHP